VTAPIGPVLQVVAIALFVGGAYLTAAGVAAAPSASRRSAYAAEDASLDCATQNPYQDVFSMQYVPVARVCSV
jgi:hypothetical protein